MSRILAIVPLDNEICGFILPSSDEVLEVRLLIYRVLGIRWMGFPSLSAKADSLMVFQACKQNSIESLLGA